MDKPLQVAIGFTDILLGEIANDSALKPFAESIKKELCKMTEIMKKIMLIKYEGGQ